MKIEIAEPGRMTQSGSSLLKLIQNNKTPTLDLFVRESAQNSLDAYNPDTNKKYVSVEYLTGQFDSYRLADELEGITESLISKFPDKKYQYLAVCDSNTHGLTGPMDVNDVPEDNSYGNLLKLVYEICKPQEAEGAGGSWGLGKTVYFRIGMGLVIYYSRIRNEDGSYSSRLAASLVENESDKDAMIPRYKGMAKRGIAWWGEQVKENATVPITDESYIEKFLSIFGMSPYTGEKTGTAIIIPYIDEKTLLASNRVDYSDELEEHFSPYWYSSIESYLRIAIQRWYAPRLANSKYPYGAFLRASVNGEGISRESMEPVFKTVQSLYNRANHVVDEDFLSEVNAEVYADKVIVKKYLADTNAGTVACTKLSRDALKMNVPHNKPEPAVYFNCEIAEKNINRPFVFFVRKPGMIVSYEHVSAWTAGIPSTNKNEYILGIFVLNSPNTTKGNNPPVANIEEYIRKSEMADHTSWSDWGSSDYNPRIVSKIQKSVVKTISSQYSAAEDEQKTKENSELGRFLGDLILPPDGFGKGANAKAGKSNGDLRKKNPKKFTFSVDSDNIGYIADKMMVPIVLKTAANKKIKHSAFEMHIDGAADMTTWEESWNLESPFTIENVGIYIDTLDGEKINKVIELSNENKKSVYSDIEFSLRTTKQGTSFGLDITAVEEHSMKIDVIVTVHLKKKNVRPLFVFEKGVK